MGYNTTVPITLHVIHTNDFHNRLTSEGTAKLKEVVAALNGAPYLLIDAGDAIGAGNIGVNPFGEPILDTMSELGYHAMTMGNREFHVWHGALATKINRARFPILSANVRSRQEGASLPVVPHVTIETGGLKVVLFGLTVPMVTERMAVAPLSAFLFDSPIETAKAMVSKLRWEADVLIALTHIGLREDERLARNVSGIDLIVGGHSHISLTEPQVVEGTPIVQAGCYARMYGHTILTIDTDGKVTVESGTLKPLQEKPT